LTERNPSPQDNEKVELKREVGLISGITLIVGTMIGSGIFVSPKGVLEGSGSVGLSLVIWAACGVVSLMGALCYAELGSMIQSSGGEHAYFMYAYAKYGKMMGPIPAFLYDWVGLFIMRPTMFSIMTLSAGIYAAKPFYLDCDPPDSVIKLITVLAMLTIAFINGYSVKLATNLQIVCTVSKLLTILIITVGGIYKIVADNTETIKEGFESTQSNPAHVAVAFYNGLWAYDTWNNLNFVTEEMVNPSRNLPLAIMIGIPLVTVCYVLANIGYFGVMTRTEILVSHAVAVTWGDHVLGVMAWIMPVMVFISCFGAANGCLFASGRLCYAAAREGHFPKMFSFISIKRVTPLPSIALMAFVGILLVLPGDLSTLIDMYSFVAWIVYGSAAFTVIVLRRTEPDLKRDYRVPLPIPVLVVLTSLYLVLAPIIQEAKVQYVYAVIFILCGLVVYFPLVYAKSFEKQLTPVLAKEDPDENLNSTHNKAPE
ncbi:hypothetical protein FSP39_015003, partial [Pinctada imbricata]